MTTQSAEAGLDLTVDIEDLSPTQKKLSITVSGESVADQIGGALDTLSEEATIPGFRRGRAPRRLVERKFGSTVRSEAKSQIIATAFSEAIEEHKLRVVGDPEPEEKLDELEVEPGTPLTFTVIVEVIPEFELPDFDKIEVMKPLIEPKDEDVDAQIERMGVNEGELESVDAAEPGDYCIGDGAMVESGGEELLNVPGAVIQVPTEDQAPEGQILGIKVDDFSKQVGSPKEGDELTIKATGPEGHEREDIRGKDLTITFKVNQVQRIIPKSADELVAALGMESEQQLREALMLRLNQKAMVDQQSAMRQQIADYLIDACEFEAPEKVTARQAERNLQRARMEMLYRGVDESEIEQRLADIRSGSGDRAARELKLFFILNKAAEELSVDVADEEILGRIAQMAAERGERPDKLRQEMVKHNQIGNLAAQIREHKTMDAVLAKASVKEVSVEEFNAARGGESSGSGSAPKKKTTKKKTKKKTAKKS